MRKIVCVPVMLFLISYSVFSISPAGAFSGRDSLRTKWMDGKKFLMHKVKKGETFYSISRGYKTEVRDVMDANKGVTQLKTGQIIQVPVPANSSASERRSEKKEPVTSSPGASQKMQAKTDDEYHVVKKGETLSSVSRKYNCSLKNITEWNHLKNNHVSMGQRLIVKKGTVVTVSNSNAVPGVEKISHDAGPATHTVSKGETVYSISKKYGVTPAEISEWNHLTNYSIEVGQQLIVKKQEKKTAPENQSTSTEEKKPVVAAGEEKKQDEEKAENNSIKESENTAEKINTNDASPSTSVIDKTPSGKNIRQSLENGEAAWVSDGDLNPNKYFALHRTAPIGTIMKVTNRMNGKFVFVKVIGRLPGTGDNENLIVKVSKAAADKMGVIDKTFQCELNYAFAEN